MPARRRGVYAVAVYFAARSNEIAALTAGDLDFTHGRFHITKQVDRETEKGLARLSHPRPHQRSCGIAGHTARWLHKAVRQDMTDMRRMPSRRKDLVNPLRPGRYSYTH